MVFPTGQIIKQYDIVKFSKLLRIPLNDILLFNSLFEVDASDITEADNERFNSDIEKVIKERGLKVHGK